MMLPWSKIGMFFLMFAYLTKIGNTSVLEDLAKAAQNPIAKMISWPFQFNTFFQSGPKKKPLHVLYVQPVIPFSLNPNWNLITRTILPLISDPAKTDQQKRINGLGDAQMSFFFSPAQPLKSGWIVGAGFVGQAQTHTNERLNLGSWGCGPTAVALRSTKKWTYGALINNVWSKQNMFLLQPFANYNFPSLPGTYLTSSPIITANWKASGKNQWTIPVGLGIGQITKIAGQAINVQMSFYYNAARPTTVSPWAMRLQIQLLFPKK